MFRVDAGQAGTASTRLPVSSSTKALTARGNLVKEKLAQETAIAVGYTSTEFEAFIKAEQARWKPVIERAQIRPEGMG